MSYHLIMGNQAYSSWSLRGWLLLKSFGIEFDHEVVPLYVPGYEQFLADHYPANTVPTLQAFDGSGKDHDLGQSRDRRVSARTTSRGWNLAHRPARPSRGAKSLCRDALKLRGVAFEHADECAPVYKSIKPDAETQRDIDRIEDLWTWAASRWGGAGPYLFGENFCAVDAFYAPLASRFHTYSVPLKPASQRYADALLNHPAVVEFYEAGMRESWVLEFNEFDQE